MQLETMSREAIGRKYGVTGNSIKKWAIKYNLLLTTEEKTARDVAGEAVQAKQIVCVLGKDQPAS